MSAWKHLIHPLCIFFHFLFAWFWEECSESAEQRRNVYILSCEFLHATSALSFKSKPGRKPFRSPCQLHGRDFLPSPAAPAGAHRHRTAQRNVRRCQDILALVLHMSHDKETDVLGNTGSSGMSHFWVKCSGHDECEIYPSMHLFGNREIHLPDTSSTQPWNVDVETDREPASHHLNNNRPTSQHNSLTRTDP